MTDDREKWRQKWERAAKAASALYREIGDAEGRGDRAARAALRRLAAADGGGDAVNVVPALAVAAFRRFLDALQVGRSADVSAAEQRSLEYAAVAAAAIAYVRDGAWKGQSTAQLLGKPAGEPLFAEPRFVRLMRCETPADLLPQAKRLVAILDGVAPVADLGGSLALWGPGVRKRWAFAYWSQGQPDTADAVSPANESVDADVSVKGAIR